MLPVKDQSWPNRTLIAFSNRGYCSISRPNSVGPLCFFPSRRGRESRLQFQQIPSLDHTCRHCIVERAQWTWGSSLTSPPLLTSPPVPPLRRDLQHRATDFSNQTCCEMDPIDLGAAPRCHAGHHACEIREHRGRRYELALEVVVVRTM